jgi:amino acid permease
MTGEEDTDPDGGTTMGLAEDTDFPSFMSALMGIVFAFSGIEVYLEFIAEMKEPQEFYLSLRASLVTVGGVYLAVAGYTYSLYGQNTPSVLTSVIPQGTPLRVANGLLLVHLVATYLIKQQVVLRACQLAITPENANSSSVGARMQWLLFSIIMLLFSWLLANAIPFFGDFCSLLGAFMDTTLCIILPVIIALKAFSLSFARLGMTEVPLLKVLVVFGTCVAVLGCIGTTMQLIEDWDEFGYPFTCMKVSEDDRE